MSDSVHCSAAANYAVADSDLNNQGGGQYHQYSEKDLYNHDFDKNHKIDYGFSGTSVLEDQQQSTSMSVSVNPQDKVAVGAGNPTAAAAAAAASTVYCMDNEQATTSAKARELLMASQEDMPTTSAMAGAGAAPAADESTNSVNNGSSHTAEMLTQRLRMCDEGRYETQGATSLAYQKHELEQQQTPNAANNHMYQTMAPSLMDNEEESMSNLNMEVDDNLEDAELYNILKEYDALQDKYHTVLVLPMESMREVTAGGRDGSAYVLRCLKIWYELPSDVLFTAMSLVDRFLERMAVKPKHMSCISVASFHLAIWQLNLKFIPANDLVAISQCGCSASELERMASIIANKLGVQMRHAPVTAVSFLRIYFALFRNLAKDIGGQFFEFYRQLIKLEALENRLEILLCDVKTAVITPSTLALILICLHLDLHIKESYTRGSPELKDVFEYILFLQRYMWIPDGVFLSGFTIVSGILSHYNGHNKQPYKQHLVWRLSRRTLRVLRPTNRFSTDLTTIDEGAPNIADDACRSRNESVSSEEEEDWPTSPIIPIFEQSQNYPFQFRMSHTTLASKPSTHKTATALQMEDNERHNRFYVPAHGIPPCPQQQPQQPQQPQQAQQQQQQQYQQTSTINIGVNWC